MSELPPDAGAGELSRSADTAAGVTEGAGVAPPERSPAWQWALRLIWLALQIILILWFGQKGVQFVYQGF